MKKLDLEKCIGVWLDYGKAYFIKPGKDNSEIEKFSSNLETHQRIDGESSSGARLGNNRSTNNEYSKHTKEQEDVKQYFKSLSTKLKPYDHILLFGASTAKNEFGNYILEDKSFNGKRIKTETADFMTENQMKAKVSEHFNS